MESEKKWFTDIETARWFVMHPDEECVSHCGSDAHRILCRCIIYTQTDSTSACTDFLARTQVARAYLVSQGESEWNL